jgi:hypothetical protein
MMKPINPEQHAVADYATAGSFLVAAGYYRNRHREASMLALTNAAAIVLLSMCTDYPGGVFRRLSFRTHGMVDGVLTALCAGGPLLFGFAHEPEAWTFYGHAAAETAVISATDFSRG